MRLEGSAQSRFSFQEVRNDFLKAMYAVMLVEMPWRLIQDFWIRHPFPFRSRPAGARDFFRFLWDGGQCTSAGYFWSVVGDLPGFLEEHGVPVDRFFQLTNHGLGCGAPVDPLWVTQILADTGTGSLTSDPREGILAVAPKLLQKLFPGCTAETVHHGQDRGKRFAYLLFHPYPSDTFRPIDFRLFPGKMLAALPRLFGDFAFDAVDVLADMRGPGLVAGKKGWSWKAETIRFGRRRMGCLETFGSLLDRIGAHGLLPAYRDRRVLIMERDFPEREEGRVLLHRGCGYGAPAYLFRLGYTETGRWKKFSAAFLPARSGGAGARPGAAWPGGEMLERLHAEFLSGLEEPEKLSIQ